MAPLVAIVAFTNGERRRALPVVRRPDGEGGLSVAAVRASRRPTVWVAAFVLGTFTIAGAAVLFVSGAGVPEGIRTLAGLVVGVGLAAAAGFHLFYGTVVTARAHEGGIDDGDDGPGSTSHLSSEPGEVGRRRVDAGRRSLLEGDEHRAAQLAGTGRSRFRIGSRPAERPRVRNPND